MSAELSVRNDLECAMSPIELQLRLSVLRAELQRLARSASTPQVAAIIRYATNVLALTRDAVAVARDVPILEGDGK